MTFLIIQQIIDPIFCYGQKLVTSRQFLEAKPYFLSLSSQYNSEQSTDYVLLKQMIVNCQFNLGQYYIDKARYDKKHHVNQKLLSKAVVEFNQFIQTVTGLIKNIQDSEIIQALKQDIRDCREIITSTLELLEIDLKYTISLKKFNESIKYDKILSLGISKLLEKKVYIYQLSETEYHDLLAELETKKIDEKEAYRVGVELWRDNPRYTSMKNSIKKHQPPVKTHISYLKYRISEHEVLIKQFKDMISKCQMRLSDEQEHEFLIYSTQHPKSSGKDSSETKQLSVVIKSEISQSEVQLMMQELQIADELNYILGEIDQYNYSQ